MTTEPHPEPGEITDLDHGYPVPDDFVASDFDDSDDEDFSGLNEYEDDDQ